MNPLLISDAYKQSHRAQYPEGTTLVYSNLTPRSDKYASTKDGVVVFGIQAFLMQLNERFKEYFFDKPLHEVLTSYEKEYFYYFGETADSSHVSALHYLGYLPLKIKALPEGTVCPIGVPMLTIVNTKPEFFWLTNFLETIMSTELWLPMTSATIAKGYKDLLTDWADKTCDDHEHIQFQAHDFSMRGMSSLEAAKSSGAGHLLSFVGSDTIPAVLYLKKFYHADSEDGMVGVSIPATEHSVMSMGSKDDEIGTFERLITEIYPTGVFSVVSDTWDLWKVLTEYLPALKDQILTRDGKVVIRPDSGDPVNIICGIGSQPTCSVNSFEDLNENGLEGTGKRRYGLIDPITINEFKGVIELLWDIFGGTVNDKGYKVLDTHIGAIYGDSITLDRANEICKRLEAKGFSSSNIVFGVGSYTYQFNTRDTYGFAMKATYGEVNGEGREIFKDPITDDGTKKSLKGLIKVNNVGGKLSVKDQMTWTEEREGALKVVYIDGFLPNTVDLETIRQRLKAENVL